MSADAAPVPIGHFLGSRAAEGGPFALLGIDPGSCTPAGIEAALQRQLDRVSQHPHADTAAADRVRVALHAAAQDLLDPTGRQVRVASYVVQEPGAVHPADAGAGSAGGGADLGSEYSRSTGDPDDSARALRKMLLILGGGGLVVIVLLLGVLMIVWPGRPAAPPAAAPAAEVPSSVGAAPAAPEKPAPGAQTDAAAGPVSDRPAQLGAPKSRAEFVEAAQVVRELRDAVSQSKGDPAKAAVQFDHAVRTLGDWWCKYDPGQRRAADDAVVEYVYAVGRRSEAAETAIGVLAGPARVLAADGGRVPPEQVWPAAWSAGVLTRLAREKDLPTPAAAGVSGALAEAFGAGRAAGELSFDAGALAAMRLLPGRILASPPQVEGAEADQAGAARAFERWWEAAAALTGADEALLERLVVDALEQVLANAREPDQDLRVHHAIGFLATRIAWREGGPARPRLMEWFADARVSSSDLRVLTSSMATRSKASGVDSTMVLAMGAQGDERARLRAAYAEAWGLAEAASRDEATARWTQTARNLVLAALDDTDRLTVLADAASFARFNEAARHLWRGESDRALSLLDDLPRELQVAANPNMTGAVGLPSGTHILRGSARDAGGSDGAWAERYLAAERNIPVRLERIGELEGATQLGVVDAGVLADAACFGSPVQVRAAAQAAAVRFANQPAMVSALLDALPIAPRIRSVSDTIEQVAAQRLPKVTDPEWELTARRALVERLLGMLATEGPQGHLENLATLIADSYLRTAGEPPCVSSGLSAADGCVRGVELIFAAWRREAPTALASGAAPLTLEQIERRRAGRRVQASGPVQVFAAEQASLMELVGYTVAEERPSRAAAVRAILDEAAARRRSAKHVYAQIRDAERGMTRLWLLRLGQEEGR